MPEPFWVVRMRELQEEFESVKDKTFFSDWTDFLFVKLLSAELEQWRGCAHCKYFNFGRSAGMPDDKTVTANFTPKRVD